MTGCLINETCCVCGSVFSTRSRNARRCRSLECKRERSRTSRRIIRSLDVGLDNERVRAWRLKSRKNVLLVAARQRAKKRGIPMTITLQDIPIPEVCPVLGIRLQHSLGHHSDSSPTLDRKDPRLGYVPGNVVVISWRANRLKSDASIAEIESVLAYMKSPQ